MSSFDNHPAETGTAPTGTGPTGTEPALAAAEPPQFSRAAVLAVWAAAAVPMGVLAWVIAPAIAGPGASERRFALTLLVALTAGLLWQALLVLFLALRDRSATGRTLRELLWLRPPSTATRRGGRLWLWAIPFLLGLAALDMLPFGLTGPQNRDFGSFLGSAAGKQTFHHAWGLYALVAFELTLNTVLGEELLFRGLLVPRMRGAFGRADWLVNGVLFGCYHLHEPWVMPNAIVTGWLCAYPTRRFRSAWLGILIHSVEAVFFLIVLIPVVAD